MLVVPILKDEVWDLPGRRIVSGLRIQKLKAIASEALWSGMLIAKKSPPLATLWPTPSLPPGI